MSPMRLASALVLLALLVAGCTDSQQIRTQSADDPNATACADPCMVVVTPTTPFEGVAGTPDAPSPTPDAAPATPADPTPPNATTPSDPTVPAPSETAAPTANGTTTSADASVPANQTATPPPTDDNQTAAAANDTAAPTPILDAPNATAKANATAPANDTLPSPTPPIDAVSNATANVTSPPAHRTRANGGVPRVSVSAHALRADGTPSGSSRWGGWQARAGERRVGGASFIAIVNTGNISDPVVTIQFATPSFVGQSDPSWLIPIAGNIEFAAFEDRDPANNSSPSKGRFDFQPASGSTITLQFHGESDVLYVAYRIVSVPSPLPAQSYSTPYTVSVS